MVTEIVTHDQSRVIEWKWASDHEMVRDRPLFTSTYLIDGLLIDSGAPGGAKDLEIYINSLDAEHAVKKCVITHAHEDHAGGAHLLQEKYNIPIFSGSQSVPILEKGFAYPDYRQVFWGEGELLPVSAQVQTGPISSASGLYQLEQLPLKGHAPDLIAYVEKQHQWAFVADMMMPSYKRIFGSTSDIQENIAEIYRSLLLLHDFTEGMDDLWIFVSGHGVFRGRDVILQRASEIAQLHEQVHEIQASLVSKQLAEPRLLRKIVRKVFGGESSSAIASRGELSHTNMVKSLLQWPLKED
ncbi:MAG: MBL fold metallo-hydrolase [Candidatus Heimdallarchaeota archaeon]|nr:MBL fold metallo-hydrolase [Candidatus Heimdallarchaeota archaeon]